MKTGKRRLVRKVLFIFLIILLGTIAALSSSLMLSVKPPTGNPTLQKLKSSSSYDRPLVASVGGNEKAGGRFSSETDAPATDAKHAPNASDSASDARQIPGSSAPTTDPADVSTASDEIYYFLVAGLDANQANMDTLLLAGLNLTDGTLQVLSIPPDTMAGSGKFSSKIQDSWRQGGVVQLEEDVAGLTGIGINRYIIASLDGMKKLAAALDAHNFHMAGNKNDDAANQDPDARQELIEAIAAKMQHSADASRLADLARLARKYIETDLTLGEMVWLAGALNGESLEDVHFHTLPGRIGKVNGHSCWIPDREAIAALMTQFR